ncbi:MAG: LysM domain-containing protein [Candidatus Limnocylindrales bacterium]
MVDPSPLQLAASSPSVPATAAVCPYLLAADGRWRSASPAREHRCTAISPPAILAADKQRRLCLAAEHVACATYQVATGQGDLQELNARAPVSRAHRISGRDLVRTAPLVLDHGRLPRSIPAAAADRGLGQGALLLLMAIAFVAIFVARLSGGTDGGDRGGILAGATTASPSGAAASGTGAAAVPTDATEPVRTLVPTAVEPSAPPTASPAPPAATNPPTPTERPTRYKVKRGDTLSGIAAAFGTTTKALQKLNAITDPSRLRIGQVLRLP